MITYNVPINAQRMTIGVQGEDNVRQFLFDVSEWRALTGDIGTAEMVVQRRGDSSPYAAVITMQDQNTVSWVPTSTDTAKAGAGKIQLMWIADGQTVKTKIFDMKVDPSLDYAVPDDSLDPWEGWITDIINASLDVKDFPGTVAEEVEDWLSTHVQPTTPAVDDTLTITGAAADAKATGNAIGTAIRYRGILNTTTVTPDTVEDIGYWTASSTTTTALIGKICPGGMFMNLRQPPNDFQQIFILTDGRVYTRYQKSGSFSSLDVAVQREMVDDPDTITNTGFYACVSAKTAIYTGINVSSMFFSLANANGAVVWQGFLLPGGKIFSRSGTTGDFTSNVDTSLSVPGAAADAKATRDAITAVDTSSLMYRGILNATTVTPDTVEDIGYWTANATTTTTIIGKTCPSGMFLNLRQPPNDFQQIFILTDGTVYTRYQKSGAFTSLNVAIQHEMVDDPDSITDTGFYACVGAKTAIYTGINVSSMFLSLTNASGAVVWQGFLLPGGKIFSRYGTTGDFRLDRPNRVNAFVPNHPLIAWTEGNLQKVKISAGNYTLPDEKTGAIALSEDVILSQTTYGVFEFAVLDTATSTFSVVPRDAVISETQVVLFTFYQNQLLNVAVSPEMFPRKYNKGLRTINDCFAPMFNRTGAPFKIVLGGDSITHGVGGTGFSQNGQTIVGNYKRNPDGYCWANLFKSYIENNYNATVLNNGVTGTQSYWWDYNKSTLIPSDTDLFILTIGTNNRIKMEGRTGTTHDEQIANYYTQMKSILEYCASINVPVLLCSSIPATQANEDKVQDGAPLYPSHVYEFNGVLQRLASEYNMAYFNLYDAFYYYAQQNNLDFATMLPDGLHPNDSTYRIMFYLYLKGFNLSPSYVPVSLPN